MGERERFVAAARSLVGRARWRHRGRKPWAVDCLGLILLSAAEAGVADRFRMTAADDVRYGREPWDDRLRTELASRFGAPVALDKWREGAIPLIRWAKSEPSHVGIFGNHPDGGLSLIHSHNLHGVVEQRVDSELRRSIVDVYWPWGEA